MYNMMYLSRCCLTDLFSWKIDEVTDYYDTYHIWKGTWECTGCSNNSTHMIRISIKMN